MQLAITQTSPNPAVGNARSIQTFAKRLDKQAERKEKSKEG